MLVAATAVVGGAIGLRPIISDIRELSANNSFGHAICAALATRGLNAYIKLLRWIDWTQCVIMLMAYGDVLVNVHTETISGNLSSVHLWNVSPETVDWLRKNAHNRTHCVYYIHRFTNTLSTTTTWSPCGENEDYGDSTGKEPVPGLPTTFLGKWVCGDKSFFFNKENVVMAAFHANVEMKQPLNIIGANVTINGDYDDDDGDVVDLPIPLNFDYGHQLTLDGSPNKCEVDLPKYAHFGSPTHLYQMLCELYTQQLTEKKWADLRQTLTMINKLKHNNYTYTINLTSMDLTSIHFTYQDQQLISGQ